MFPSSSFSILILYALSCGTLASSRAIKKAVLSSISLNSMVFVDFLFMSLGNELFSDVTSDCPHPIMPKDKTTNIPTKSHFIFIPPINKNTIIFNLFNKIISMYIINLNTIL